MEPAGWATVIVAVIGMFGAITHDVMARQKAKPQAWNGVERRMVETIAGQFADRAVLVHAGSCPMRVEIAALRDEMSGGFEEMRTAIAADRTTIAADLNAIRQMVVQLHGKA